MDNLSDSFKGELDSDTSTDSLHLSAKKLNIRHLSTPDILNVELSKRIALLELENERLKVDLENSHIQLNARIAANESLKSKVTELYVEMQLMLLEKQKLENTVVDTNNRLDAAEASIKWYQSQVHGLKESKKTLQLEIDTYQGILQQKQQTIMNRDIKNKQLDAHYAALFQRYRKENHNVEHKAQNFKIENQSNNIEILGNIDAFSSPDIATKLEMTEDELQVTKAKLKALEKRLLSNEIPKMLMKRTSTKHCVLIATMNKHTQKYETENNQTDVLGNMHLDIHQLKSENKKLRTALLSSELEQSQIEEAIFQLQIQLTKMITQYKVLKLKSMKAEKKVNSMQDIINESKYLKTLSYETNSALIRKLRQDKYKVKSFGNKLCSIQAKEYLNDMKNKTEISLCEYLKQVLIRNKDLEGQLMALRKTSDEAIDEGYGDNSIISSVSIDIPSPASISSILLNTVSNVLSRSKNFCKPMQVELDQLHIKLHTLKKQYSK